MNAAIQPDLDFYQDTKINPKLVRKSIQIEKIISEKNNRNSRVIGTNPYINNFERTNDDSLFEKSLVHETDSKSGDDEVEVGQMEVGDTPNFMQEEKNVE